MLQESGYWVVNTENYEFNYKEQPADFEIIAGIENKFYIVRALDGKPKGDYVVEFPLDLVKWIPYYQYANGKKLPFDPFNGEVSFGETVDLKNRREIIFTDEQLNMQLTLIKWLMLNVWVPDRQQRLGVSDAAVSLQLNEIDSLTDSEAARTYIRKNLYYNL